ncbi:response regulator transcription factor, partial [Escherichia coli]|uniref:response regulator transcription factor n=1 Tax=Escherichia coli TaxID=562 RepID=UPI001412E316
AILRRMPEAHSHPTGPKIVNLGPLRYDVERAELMNGDKAIRLTSTESALMRIFAANLGEAMSRSRLVEDLGRDKGQAQE